MRGDQKIMPYRYETLSISKLLLDQSNARLGEEQPSQEAAQLTLATLIDNQLLVIAADILDNGLDPTSLTAVTQEKAPRGAYRVIEGNRRLLALQALAAPSIVDSVLNSGQRRRLLKLSALFAEKPLKSIFCAVFDTEDEAQRWIELRHTGANNGMGLVEWDANEKNRYRARHSGLKARSAAGQILDFVDQVSPVSVVGNSRVYTTLERLISTPDVRGALGIAVERGVVYSNYPRDEIIKGLVAVVQDLKSGNKKVTDVYYQADRKKYAEELPPQCRPDPTTRLAARVELSSLLDSSEFEESSVSSGQQSLPLEGADPAHSDGERPEFGAVARTGVDQGQVQGELAADRASSTQQDGQRTLRRSRVREPKPRSSTIPASCVLRITHPRINAIYHELIKLEVDAYSNACSVLLRVFVELSTDYHIAQLNVTPESDRRSSPLAKKLKDLASRLRNDGKIDQQLEKAVIKIADGQGMFSASTVTFNQYVHNQFVYPHPRELRTAWDELQPFMQALWGR